MIRNQILHHAYSIREDTELILDLDNKIFGRVTEINHDEQTLRIAVTGNSRTRGDSFSVDFETCHLLLDRQDWLPFPELGMEVDQYCDYGARILPPPETN